MKTLAALLAMAAVAPAFSAQYQVQVEAPEIDLDRAIITAAAPADFPQMGELRHSAFTAPFQKNSQGEIVFVTSLRKGQPLALEVAEAGSLKKAADARLDDGRVWVSAFGKPIFTYQGKEELPRADIQEIYKRSGYIHPVYSPGGKLITDDYSPNHVHHHGIWAPWTKTVFEGRTPDFWNMGEGKGKVELAKLGAAWSGPVHAGFSAQHRFVDLTSGQPKTALNETWTVTAYAIPGADYFVFDLVSTQECATASALLLPKYHYGGMGFRGNWGWNGANGCKVLTSNGETDRIKAHETRANWCHIGGMVDGALAGAAILCHPSNFRAPQPMRVHPTEPFFCYAPSQLGDWSIEPGQPYVSRYRFVVSDGAPDKAALERHWAAYAHLPKVTVSKR